MQGQPIREECLGEPDSTLKQALLGALIHDHPGLWSLAELDRYLQASGRTPVGEEPARYVTEDAVEQLYSAGLLHRVGQFVFATRAALESARADG